MGLTLLLLIPGLPLLAALGGYALRRHALLLAGIALAVSAAASVLLLSQTKDSDTRITLASISLPSAQRVPPVPADPKTHQQYVEAIGQYLTENPPLDSVPLVIRAGRSQLLFTLSTSLIALLCLLFATGGQRRIVPTLTLFSAAMLLFLTADTLLLVYVAWELMGLCSFLLIASPGTARARRAAREAFWTTRATDGALLLGIIILMGKFGPFGWTTLSGIDLAPVQQFWVRNAAVMGLDVATALHTQVLAWVSAAGILIIIGVVGKTALLPLSFWLPEAMVAPTPVSALLHAATMVAAGPFLLLQLEPLLAPSQAALATLTLLAGASVLLCGAMALCARDAKRVLAYSTISQLSVPLLGVGVLAPGPALFHILAHAWFKAPLFLTVGYLAAAASRHAGGRAHVEQHSGSEDDADDHTSLSRLSGSARAQPLARLTLIIGGLALAGAALTGGYFGKEQVLLALLHRSGDDYAGHTFASLFPVAAASWRIGSVLLLLSVPITAAYTARLVGIMGWGKPPAELAALDALPGGAGVPPASVTAETAAPPIAGRGGPSTTVLLLLLLAAGIGCIVMPIFFGLFEHTFSTDAPWRWRATEPVVAIIDMLLLLGGALLAWLLNVSRPRAGAEVERAGNLVPLADAFDNGLYLRNFWLAIVGTGGALLAQLAGRGEVKLDYVVRETGHDGRRLARAAAWFDRHVVDGLRYWGAEVWWVIRRLHQRWMQNGSIQRYMYIVLLCAVALCLVIIKPLAQAFADIFSRSSL